MTTLTAACPAKINLGLEAIERREDGYHVLVTIFQALTLADTLSVTPADEISLECTDGDLTGPDNLCSRAAVALRAATGTRQGARLQLVKRIPAAAGLGGGSSDAALTLRLLDRLWGTDLGAAALATLAAGLGADVPFFLNGPTALATGIGEVLTPLPTPLPIWLVLLRPALTLTNKTAHLYRALTPADWSDGVRTRAQADRLRTGQSLDASLVVNVFSRPLRASYPAVAAAEADLRAAGAGIVFPAGSGPTLVAPCPDQEAAERLAASVTAPGRVVLVTRTADDTSPHLAVDAPDPH